MPIGRVVCSLTRDCNFPASITTDYKGEDLNCFVGDSFCVQKSGEPGETPNKLYLNINDVHLMFENGISNVVGHRDLLAKLDKISKESMKRNAVRDKTVTISSDDEASVLIGEIGYVVEKNSRLVNCGYQEEGRVYSLHSTLHR